MADFELLFEDRRHPVPHDPARECREREVQHEQDEGPVAEQLRKSTERRTSFHFAAVSRSNGVLQEKEERHRVKNAHHSARIKRPTPTECRVIGHIAAEAADNDPGIDAHLMQADRARPRRPNVKIRDQRERRRNVKRLADSHQRTRREKLLVGHDLPRQPRHERPHK